MHHWTRLIGWLSLGLLIIASFILVLRYVEKAPFFYLGLETFFVLLFLSYKLKKHNFLKAFSFNLAIVILLLGLAEAYFAWFSAPPAKQEKVATIDDYGNAPSHYYVYDEIRGYAATGNVKKRSKKMLGNKVLYDVTYTTNQHGLRVSPHDLASSKNYSNKDVKNVVFFGDSFTYGEGVNDNETFPFLFEKLSEGKYKTYNFAFHGYGPHQMLRILETGLLDEVMSGNKPSIAIYLALIEHIDRASGKILWDYNVPKYKLSPSGTPEFVGSFKSNLISEDNQVKNLKNPRSQLFSRIGLTRLFDSKRSAEDIELFIKMVVQAKNILENKYNAKFYVMVWPLGDPDTNSIIVKLKENHIEVINVNQIFGKYKDPPEKYRIEIDNHPTKLAHERIAKYLLEYLN
jgi:hypothetical protein